MYVYICMHADTVIDIHIIITHFIYDQFKYKVP